MKKTIRLIVCSTAIFALYSCNFFGDKKPSENTKEKRTVVEHPDSAKQKNVKQDALMTKLLNKVDTLTAKLDTARNDITDLEKRTAELESSKSTWNYISIVSFTLGLIAIVMSLFMYNRVKKKKVYDTAKKCLDDLLSKQRTGRTSRTGSFNESDIESRLRQLESEMRQVFTDRNKITNAIQHPTSPAQEMNELSSEPEYPKVGYAKNDKDMYFTTIYNSNIEGCVFKISFTSPTKGKFNIISLDKIQSRNDWQQKVECSGISIKEASVFRIENDGICEKMDENTWQVTKPLKIRLLK